MTCTGIFASRRREFAAAAFSVLALPLIGCGSGSNNSAPSVATIEVAAAQPSVAVGQTDQFTATAKDSSGNVLPDIAFTWASTSSGTANINASGVASALLPGTTQITASAAGVSSAPATLTVTPGFLLTGNMVVARSDATATLLNDGTVLIAGGVQTGTYLSESEIYNPATGTFTATGSLNTARDLASATLLNDGEVLIAGGQNSSGLLASAELYDPGTKVFTPTGNLNVARRFAPAVRLQNGMVLIAGGYGESGSLASAELYDPAGGIFSQTGSLNTARRLTTATLLPGGLVLFAGGFNDQGDGVLQTAELYNPGTGSFTFTGNLVFPRYYHTATLLNDGSVFVTGGATSTDANSPPFPYSEVYDPSADMFSVTGELIIPAYDATATLLNDGTVLVVSGYSSRISTIPSAAAQLYDPSTGNVNLTGDLNTGRVDDTATLLPNGMVLVAGGFNELGPLMTAELYEPSGSTPAGQSKKARRQR